MKPIGRRSYYDEGKRCVEKLFFDYWRQQELKIKVVRIFNTDGPRMQLADGRVASNFVVQALRNEPITTCRDGQQPRSFCYVDVPKKRQPDITHANIVLAWEPKVPLEEGLEQTIQYFRILLSELIEV